MAIVITHTQGHVDLEALLKECAQFKVLEPEEARAMVQRNLIKSGVFSRDVARVFSNQLGVDIPTRWLRLAAHEGDSLLVGLLPTPPRNEWDITWILFHFDEDARGHTADTTKNTQPPTLH